jgi:hypothetical protein
MNGLFALYLNRRLWPFTALNSWTGGVSTGCNSWMELLSISIKSRLESIFSVKS